MSVLMIFVSGVVGTLTTFCVVSGAPIGALTAEVLMAFSIAGSFTGIATEFRNRLRA